MNNEKKTERATRRYAQLQNDLERLPWLLNGSVMEIQPQSPNANTTYTWTRKIKAKTVTLALSRQQYVEFKKAIQAHRRVEKALTEMRAISEEMLLGSLPGVRRKKTRRSNQKTEL